MQIVLSKENVSEAIRALELAGEAEKYNVVRVPDAEVSAAALIEYLENQERGIE